MEAHQDRATKSGTFRRLGGLLGINTESPMNPVRQAEIDHGPRTGITSSEVSRVPKLETANRELRRTNSILHSASALFAAEHDRPQRGSWTT